MTPCFRDSGECCQPVPDITDNIDQCLIFARLFVCPENRVFMLTRSRLFRTLFRMKRPLVCDCSIARNIIIDCAVP
ncbi:hypothetical protein LG58_2505 [Kosakonia radicincitans YD4]|nr:hypothetical protein LG58_2505 [Kosakonia radicincitans YD4]